MKLIIVLCLGTLVLSAPAPQGKRQIDFLWQNSQDEETPASVQPVELSTVEPKVTATKITDPRKFVPVREEEEEADVQEEPREPSPTASPLNSEQEGTGGESDSSENNEQREEDSEDGKQENEDQTEAAEVGTTERAIIDTTIRVYDEEEENGKNVEKEEDHTEQAQIREQTEEQEPQQEQKQLNDQEDREHEQEQRADLSDSYQYDDESLEQHLQEVRTESPTTTTDVPESNPEITVTDAGFDIEVKGGTLVVDKDTFENLKPGLQNWHHHDFNGPFDYHGPHHHRGHNGDGHRGPPHNHPRPHGDGPFGSGFHGPPPPGHGFDGPPPPWVHGHRFHHDHPHDHKPHFKGHEGPKGYPFHDNMFFRSDGSWPSWKTALSSEEGLPTKVNNLSE